MKIRRWMIWLLTAALTAGMFAGCHKAEKDGGTSAEETSAELPAETESGENAEDKSAENEGTEDMAAAETEADSMLPEMKIVTDAVHSMIDGHGFSADTTADLSLNGSLVQGDYEICSDVHLLRAGNGDENLQMTTVSSSDMDDIVTKTYYRDGIYHVSDGTRVTETEESADTVMSGVSQITDMVLEAADSVEQVSTEEENGKTLYTYEIPVWMAEDYVKTLVNTLQIEQLDGTKISLESAVLTTEVNEAGLITAQTISLEGEIHKTLLSVPASVKISAEFASITDEKLDFSEFDF